MNQMLPQDDLQNLSQGVQPVVQQPVQPPAPQKGLVSNGHPEQKRIIEQPRQNAEPRPTQTTTDESRQTQEQTALKEAKANLELAKEVLPGLHEVHHHSEPITLPSLLTNAGVTPTGLPPGAMIIKSNQLTLPLTEAEIKKDLHYSPRKSARWLAEWCVKQLKEAHLIVKRIKKKKA